jgi:hypothetical protein
LSPSGYIKELGLQGVELTNMDMAEKQHKAPEFLKVRPAAEYEP